VSGFFQKRFGRIIYIPGISRRHKSMHQGGLDYIGIQTENGGPFIATVIDPESRFLRKKIKFIQRDSEKIIPLDPKKRPVFRKNWLVFCGSPQYILLSFYPNPLGLH
jgi:hypothetical protein